MNSKCTSIEFIEKKVNWGFFELISVTVSSFNYIFIQM